MHKQDLRPIYVSLGVIIVIAIVVDAGYVLLVTTLNPGRFVLNLIPAPPVLIVNITAAAVIYRAIRTLKRVRRTNL